MRNVNAFARTWLFVLGVAALTALLPSIAAADWNLAQDVVAGGTNPAAPIGAGQWSYYSGGALLTGSTSPATSATDLNSEVPDQATGWYKEGSNWIMAARFEVDNNPVAPNGTGDDKTNFQTGHFGGHADTRARWTSLTGGTYKIDYLGYNARNQATASPGEQGRQTTFLVEQLDSAGALITTIASQVITGGVEDGISNAVVGSSTVTLAANESIQIGHAGNEWSGYDLTVSIVPEPSSALLALMSLIGLPRLRR